MPLQTTSRPKKSSHKPDSSEIFSEAELLSMPTAKEVRKRNLQLLKEHTEYKKGDFFHVPGKISYHIAFTCPACKHKNSIVYKNIHTTCGPEWSVGVPCQKCGVRSGFIEETEED